MTDGPTPGSDIYPPPVALLKLDLTDLGSWNNLSLSFEFDATVANSKIKDDRLLGRKIDKSCTLVTEIWFRDQLSFIFIGTAIESFIKRTLFELNNRFKC